MTVAEWLAKAEDALAQRRVPEAAANAELLMAHVLKASRPETRLQSHRAINETQGRRYWSLVLERGRRLPLAYVLGSQSFLDLNIAVNPNVLIPRPETEELVMEAARRLKSRENEALHLLEIGTGTGCVAIALARLFPKALIYATDISPAALKLAQANADAYHCGPRLRFVKEDLFRGGSERRGWADLVISNPPYIPSAEIGRLEPEVLKEPTLALDGGADGLDAVRAIVAEAPAFLKKDGWLALEIGADQGPRVSSLLQTAGLRSVEIRPDHQGLDRIAVGQK